MRIDFSSNARGFEISDSNRWICLLLYSSASLIPRLVIIARSLSVVININMLTTSNFHITLMSRYVCVRIEIFTRSLKFLLCVFPGNPCPEILINCAIPLLPLPPLLRLFLFLSLSLSLSRARARARLLSCSIYFENFIRQLARIYDPRC